MFTHNTYGQGAYVPYSLRTGTEGSLIQLTTENTFGVHIRNLDQAKPDLDFAYTPVGWHSQPYWACSSLATLGAILIMEFVTCILDHRTVYSTLGILYNDYCKYHS
jgi:hypothetical protein